MTVDRPLVTIIIPVYRGEPFLREAILSALAQSWPNIEVLVIDDGSDDQGATERIARSFGDSIRYVKKENGGVATALNVGIAAARGDYISWLSHDDRYHPLKVERQMNALLAQDGPAIVFGDYQVIDEGGRILALFDAGKGFEPERALWTVFEGRLNGCAMLFPRQCFDVCGSFDPGLPTTQDYALWFDMIRRFRLIHVPGYHVAHRTHAGQGSRSTRHLEEVSLLWLSMLDGMTTEEMRVTGGSAARFLTRVQRRFRESNLHLGAAEHVEKHLRRHIAELNVALVWVNDGDGGDIEAAIAAIEQAGATVTDVTVLETTRQAGQALQLRSRRWAKPLRILRVSADSVAESLPDAARCSAAPLVFLADRLTPVQSASIRGFLEGMIMGEADGFLQQLPAADGPLPQSLRGALLDRAALLEAVADLAGTKRWIPALGLRLRLAFGRPAPGLPAYPVRQVPHSEASSHGALSLPQLVDAPGLLIVTDPSNAAARRMSKLLGAACSRRVRVFWTWGSNNHCLRLSSASPGGPALEIPLPTGIEQAVCRLRDLNVRRIAVVRDQGLEYYLPYLTDALGVPLDVLLGNHAELPASEDENEEAVGNARLAADSQALGVAHSSLLANLADRLLAPSRDAAARVLAAKPALPVIAARVPEPGTPDLFAVHPAPLAADETARILILDHPGAGIGADVVQDVARLCAESGLACEFHLLGEGSAAALSGGPNIHAYGSYADESLNRIVCRLRPHFAWLPFTLPQAHSFALSDAMLQGLPILAVGLGDVAERLHGRSWTWVIDPERACSAEQFDWIARLVGQRLRTPPAWLPVDHLPSCKQNFFKTEFLEPLLSRMGHPASVAL